MANGKIRDMPRRRDPSLKIQDHHLKNFSKIRARDSVRIKLSQRLQFAKIRAGFENCSQQDMSYTIIQSKINRYNQVKSVARNHITFFVACSVNVSLYAFVIILGFHVASEKTEIKNFEFLPSSGKSHF